MKKNNKPRTLVLTGMSEECRQIAKKAAKAEHITLAKWFEARIIDYYNIKILKQMDGILGEITESQKSLIDELSKIDKLSKIKTPWYIRLSNMIFRE